MLKQILKKVQGFSPVELVIMVGIAALAAGALIYLGTTPHYTASTQPVNVNVKVEGADATASRQTAAKAEEEAIGNYWYVMGDGTGDFTKIQAALMDDRVVDGDTIMVGPGEYAGADVSKSVSIIGSGTDLTSIVTSEIGYSSMLNVQARVGFRIRVSNVTISNFKIVNNVIVPQTVTNGPTTAMIAGILIDGVGDPAHVNHNGIENVNVSHNEIVNGTGWPITAGVGNTVYYNFDAYSMGIYSNGGLSNSVVSHNKVKEFNHTGILWYGLGLYPDNNEPDYQNTHNLIAFNEITSNVNVPYDDGFATVHPAGMTLFPYGDGGNRHATGGCLQLSQGVISDTKIIHNKISRASVNPATSMGNGWGIYIGKGNSISTTVCKKADGTWTTPGTVKGLITGLDIGFNDLRGSDKPIGFRQTGIQELNTFTRNLCDAGVLCDSNRGISVDAPEDLSGSNPNQWPEEPFFLTLDEETQQ